MRKAKIPSSSGLWSGLIMMCLAFVFVNTYVFTKSNRESQNAKSMNHRFMDKQQSFMNGAHFFEEEIEEIELKETNPVPQDPVPQNAVHKPFLRKRNIASKERNPLPENHIRLQKILEEEATASHNGAHESITEHRHQLAGLSCEKYGGPSADIAAEMVYWSDIPSDSNYKSPFYDEEKYLTFEPDHGGWNNIRMAMETILVMAHAMGRTLVLPPAQKMYLLDQDENEHKTEFSFLDFFHLDSIGAEHQGLNIITMQEFLTKAALKGRLKVPPSNRVNWDGTSKSEIQILWKYLREVGHVDTSWNPKDCIAAFPTSTDPKHIQDLKDAMVEINSFEKKIQPEDYEGKPVPVDAPAIERLKENLAAREKLCIYDEEMQQKKLVHFKVQAQDNARMLTHFYSFVFFQDWKQDLWTKRFVRDHVRYIDEIMCATARVVHALRERIKENSQLRISEGIYDSIHVRRGDFQYLKTRLEAEELYDQSKDKLEKGGAVYIATDEQNKTFFKPFSDHYNVYFLDDFKDVLSGINTNYYGMLDQLVASRGRVFFGTWWSSYSGYVNRIRGYHVSKNKLDGYDQGVIGNSWYFNPKGVDRREEMQVYRPVRLPLYMREFPTSWRYIDYDLPEEAVGEVKNEEVLGELEEVEKEEILGELEVENEVPGEVKNEEVPGVVEK